MKRFLLILGIVVGGLLALGPFWGFLGTMLGMQRAFETLGSAGISDPQALSSDIGLTLTATWCGLLACPLGIGLATVCIVFLVQSTRRAPTPPLPAAPR